MPRLLPVLAAASVPLAILALPRPDPELLSACSAHELLSLSARPAPGSKDGGPRAPLWEELLTGPALERRGEELVFRIAGARADPTPSHLCALETGELLRLPVLDDPAGTPLWKVILDGPAVERTEEGLVLRLYGCRFTADPGLGPVIEDTYTARLSLARAFEALAQEHLEYPSLSIRGADAPAKGGANFEVQLIGDQHMVEVTVDGQPREPVFARRSFRPDTPNDRVLRASLARGLRQAAARSPELAGLVIEGTDEPAEGGTDFRLEYLAGQQTLVASRAGSPALSVRRPWAPPNPDMPFGLSSRLVVPLAVLLTAAPLVLGLRPRARGSSAREGPSA